MENKALLSLCFPTYNRGALMAQQLERLNSMAPALLKQMEIIVSDNCSTDDTEKIVKGYIEGGLPCSYYKNSSNLGMDGNFVACFKRATGKYVWLLGDDDTIIESSLEKLLSFLSEGDYGLVHIYQKADKPVSEFDISTDDDWYCRKISYFSTFISSNIVQTKYVPDIDFEKYMGTWFTLMPLYIRSLHCEEKNAIVYYDVFEPYKDSKRNGGYNFFKVFVQNYLNIWKEAENLHYINHDTYKYIKRDVYVGKIDSGIKNYLILKKKSNFTFDGAWIILFRYYGLCPYAYSSIIKSAWRGLTKRLHINE